MDRPRLRLSLYALREACRIGLHNPLAIMSYVFGGLGVCVEQQLYSVVRKLGFDSWGMVNYWLAIRNESEFNEHIRERLQGVDYGQVVIPELLYVLVRKLCPAKVVETGVAAGVSSAYILQALEDNQYGKLYSIDYPNYSLVEGAVIPEGEETGFVVPDYLRDRWELKIGKSQELLSPLLEKLGKIDIFLHDSEHSYKNMSHEYKVAWQYLNKGGLLMSHDINDNNAFKEFAIWHGKERNEIYFTGMGVMRK